MDESHYEMYLKNLGMKSDMMVSVEFTDENIPLTANEKDDASYAKVCEIPFQKRQIF